MANFNEHSLEMSIMELFQDEGYVYLNGEQIHRERSEAVSYTHLDVYKRQAIKRMTLSDGSTNTS